MNVIISLGSSPKLMESIDRLISLKRDSFFFDWSITNFETVLYYIKHIDNPILPENIEDTGIIDKCTGYRIVGLKNNRLLFTNNFPSNISFNSHLPIYVQQLNKKLNRLKKMIMTHYYIDFIHLLDDVTNQSFKSNPLFKSTDLYIPTNQMINEFVSCIQKINPNLQFFIHMLVPPDYVNTNKSIIDTLLNPHLKIQYMTKDNDIHAITGGPLELHWNWEIVFQNLKKNVQILPYDFDPVIYKKIYPDLASLTDENAKKHYIQNGFFEGRIYKIDNDIDFDPVVYKKIYKDLSKLTDEQAILH